MATTLAEERKENRTRLFTLLKEDIRCVFERDPAARSTIEVVTTYPGIHAIAAYRVAHRLWKWNRRYLARLLSFVARMFTGIDIHPGACIGRRFFIDHGTGVVIGETAEIGDDVTLYHGVTLGGTSWNPGKRHPTLENGVMVGAGAKILGPVTVGHGARVGANAVVIQDVPAGMTVVGIPGRVVLPTERRRVTPHGIDLDHHLMPDPVGKAIHCLMERIGQLEAQIAAGLHRGQEAIGEDCNGCMEAPSTQCQGTARGKEPLGTCSKDIPHE
ncbi:MAG: serine O-acetyltransferase [Pseudomonadota bacterium]